MSRHGDGTKKRFHVLTANSSNHSHSMSIRSEELTLIPRKYQEEIFELAKNENIIAALDTGSGKTLIAVLLIRWMTSRLAGDHKICVFMVPRVPLVEQQTAFLSSQLPVTVRGYYGALVDPWQHDPVRWKKEFEECNIMVMTPQIFLDAILHAHWSMEQVSLLIFDEAHHARKNSPYNQILREFYHTLPRHHRPKVFGMTASPVWNINNPLQSLKELENNMLSKVVGVRENLDELAENSPRPNETIVQYHTTTRYSTYPRSLWQKLQDNDLHVNPIFVADRIELRYSVTVDELGPFAADVYLATYLDTILLNHAASNMHNYIVGLMGHGYIFNNLASQGPSFTESSQVTAEDMLAIRKLLEEFIAIGFKEESFVVPKEWISPKLRTLASELCARRHDSFQGMIFVEQRQIAVTLAWILSKICELKTWIFPGTIVGHGAGRVTSTQGMADKKQKQTLNFFRTGVYNLLVSTSVGEEGLDFQACDLVVRFNELQHLVGYLQSRGRARRFESTYLVMVPSDDVNDNTQGRSRYERLKHAEPSIRKLYQQRYVPKAPQLHSDEEAEEDPVDLAIREQFIIRSTGAVLTFGSAVSLLSHLCALIPRDRFTKAIQPVYEGEFQVAVTLPGALPIPRDKLTYEGGVRNSKREAKAAAAFVACKALFDPLNVFDQYFLPVSKTSGHAIKDADDRPIPDLENGNQLLDVLIYDPWLPWDIPDTHTTFTAWVHPLVLPGRDFPAMALVTAGPLTAPLPEIPVSEGRVCFTLSTCVELPCDAWKLLHYFTSLGIQWCNTPKAFDELTCFLVPLDSYGNIDLGTIQTITRRPVIRDGVIKHTDEGHILLQMCCRPGVLLLRELREDLSPLSEPTPEDSEELVGQFPTYLEYFESLYTNRRYPEFTFREGPLLRVERFKRRFTSEYQHPASKIRSEVVTETEGNEHYKKVTWVPMAACDVFTFSHAHIEAFVVFPQIIRRITDIYRAREAIRVLDLPCIKDDLAVEALTLPSTNISFNNQRLETLGDSVLKICVVVYVFNKFPHRHEGQLDCLRQNSVSNRALVVWASKIRLERFFSCEPSSVKKWRPTVKSGKMQEGRWCVKRKIGRRGLQDCMESLLGASFLSGGLDMSLKTGVALQLCFGGSEPWNTRYNLGLPDSVPSLFHSLQASLGYQFTRGSLLCEAFTHPSAASDIPTYQRLEFLGDAILDLVVLEYLYHKFPEATPGQLTWAKSRAVWAPSLTTVAVQRLSLHKYLIRNNVDLEQAITKSVLEHQGMDYFHVVVEGWRYDPPKALSDVMESLCGAMFVDSHYDYDRVKPVILQIMDPLLRVLRPKLPRDPTSELYIYMAQRGCQRAKFEKFCSQDAKNKLNDSLRFKVHDIIIGEPFHAGNRGLNKVRPLLAYSILKQLEKGSLTVDGLCDCHLNRQPLMIQDIIDINRNELDDEKEDEFAILAARELYDMQEPMHAHKDDDDDDDDDDERHEVESLLDAMEL